MIGTETVSEGTLDWRQVDARLRELARRASEQDWEIGRALLEARQTRAHERLGHASLFEYVERLFGYSARVTAARLRVAESLQSLPQIDGALRGGARSWSAVREITRVATDETEAEWLAYSAGRTVRELEQAVSGLRPGARPQDPPDPQLQRRVVRLELSTEGWALFKDAVARIRREVDPRLSEDDVFMELCRRTLVPEDAGAAPYQVALTVCDHCGRTWQDAGGEQVELPPEVGDRAACDAQVLPITPVRPAPDPGGTVDTHVGRAPSAGEDPASAHVGRAGSPGGEAASAHVGRATRTIPPAARRAVIRRDGGRCRVNGCSNHTWLDLHHVRPRFEGGTNDASNLLLTCGAYHALLHAGMLLIDGTSAQDARFLHADGTPYGEPPRPSDVQAGADAYAALRSLGFSETESRQGLAAARTHVGADSPAGELVRAALRLHLRPASRAA